MADLRVKTLTWLHFSDLHFKENCTPDASLKTLAKTLEQEATKEDGLHPDLIFFSGDIADDGKTGYNEAKEVFKSLLSSTKLNKECVCIVPGNHDFILRKNDTELMTLKRELEEDEDKTKSFGDPTTLEFLIKRFQGFQDFCISYLEEPFDHRENPFFARVIPIEGLRIGFVGLNSSWVSVGKGDDEYGHMFLGVSVIKQAFERLESQGRPDLTVVMLHHPVEWLHENEQVEVRTLLREKADVVLTGHRHSLEAYSKEGSRRGSRTTLFLNVGAIDHKTGKRPKRIFFVQADVARKKLRVYPKTFINEQWETDRECFKGMKGDYEPFDLSIAGGRHTIEVKRGDIDELKRVGNLPPFMENPASGKFAKDIKWDISTAVDFSKLPPIDLRTPHRIYIIKGKAGMGKSTYMLWSLDKCFQDPSWPFRKVVFLNPEEENPGFWASDLYNCKPEETLLVVDALKRWGDTDLGFSERCRELRELTFEGKNFNEKLIGPFKALVTLRDEEYRDLRKLQWFQHTEAFLCESDITPEKLDLKMILKKWLEYYGILYTIPAAKEKEVIKKLGEKSLGSPFYIRHLAAELRRTNSSFSEDSLDEFPAGMVNLIWYTIRKTYYVEGDRAIPFLFLLLSNTNKPYSSHFLKFLVDNLSQTRKEEVAKKVDSLKDFYFQDFRRHEGSAQIENFGLNSHWRESLEEGLNQPDSVDTICRDVAAAYKTIAGTEFNRLVEEITNELKTRLGGGFKDEADAFLCIDLAKIGEEYLQVATEIYSSFCSSSHLEQDYLTYIRDELYELWISNAWKYRASHKDKEVITCYENAFDKLGVRTHLKQLSAYAYYLQSRVLPQYKWGTQEFQKWKEKIENLHNEVITRQLEQGIKDPISYQTLALFYNSIGEYQKAEEIFEKALQIDPSHFPTLQAFAIFLKDRGNIEWSIARTKALGYYKKAEELFKRGRDKLPELRAEKGKLSKEEEEYEKRLLNAYAVFLIDQAGWQTTWDEKKKYDELADKLFEEDLKKYPDHAESINKYADFLMKYGWIMPKYENGKNLEKAEELLNVHIKKCLAKNEFPDPITLHSLAILLYKFKPLFEKWPQDFQTASELLQTSSRSPNPKHNSIAYHELARLYMKWANYLKVNQKEYNNKMELANKAIQKALELPENPFNLMHLSRVYLTYAFYFIYRGEIEQARIYRDKAFEFAKQTQMVPIHYFVLLGNMGDELIEEEPNEAIEFYTRAKEVGEEIGINNSYPYFKLAECWRRLGEVEKALDNYLLSGRAENTSIGYGTRRNSIRELMKDNDIREETQPDLYHKCLQARLECSEKAYRLDPDYWKNCGDYGEDLFEVGKYEDAIPVLEEGVDLVLQSGDLSEREKRKHLSIHYEKMGLYYKYGGDVQKAEELLRKSAEMADSSICYLKLVNWMFGLEKYEKALTAFKRFTEKFPVSDEKQKEEMFYSLARSLQNIAISYEKLGKEDEAAMFWKYYADISFYFEPEKGARVYGIVGNRLHGMKQFTQARELFLKSIRLDPKVTKNLSQLGYANYRLQRWEECAICSQKAFEIEGDVRDKELYEFCQREYQRNPKVYDSSTVEDAIDQAIIKELKGQYEDAFECYSNILSILQRQSYQNETKISIHRFIADAFWALEHGDEALRLYEEIKDMVNGYEKVIVEAIIWFMKKPNSGFKEDRMNS